MNKKASISVLAVLAIAITSFIALNFLDMNFTGFAVYGDGTATNCSSYVNESSTLAGNIVGCADNGLIINASNKILDCQGYSIIGTGNGAGINISGRTDVKIVNCVLINFTYGIWANASNNLNLTNNTAYNNSYGFFIESSPAGLVSSRLYNNTAYNNSYGFFIESASANWGSNMLYGNLKDLFVSNLLGLNPSFFMDDTYFLNPSGTLENYSRLYILDDVKSGAQYSISWVSNSYPFPDDRIDFNNKYVQITNETGALSIDDVEWRLTPSDLSGYSSNVIDLWVYNGTGWEFVQNNPYLDEDSNFYFSGTLTKPGLYGVLLNNGSSYCGGYANKNDILYNDLHCNETGIFINSSDVAFDCQNHNIYLSGNSSRGFNISGKSNITISNCNLFSASGIGTENITGFVVSDSHDINLTNDFISNNLETGSMGFQIKNSNGVTIFNANATQNMYGIYAENSSINTSQVNAISNKYSVYLNSSNLSSVLGKLDSPVGGADFFVENPGASNQAVNLQNVSFTADPYTGLMISLSDSVEPGTAYAINRTSGIGPQIATWIPFPLTLPPYSSPTPQLVIVNISGVTSIDSLGFYWNESSLGLFNESNFGLLRVDGSSYAVLNTTPDTANNFIGVSNVPISGKAYLIMSNQHCLTLNTDYTLPGDLDCIGNGIFSNASDITIDCQGYKISGSDTMKDIIYSGAEGIFAGNKNVTIKNCVVANFTSGIYIAGDNATVFNNTITESATGITVISNQANLTGNSVSSVGLNGGGTGFSLYGTKSIFLNNNFVRVDNNTVGFSLGGLSNSLLAGNNATTVNGTGDFGFLVIQSSYNNFINNTVSNFADGFYMKSASDNNNLTGNVVFNCGVGFYLWGTGSNEILSNTLSNNIVYGSGSGFQLLSYGGSTSNNVLFNNTVYSNTNGFVLQGVSGNNLTGNIVFNNTNGLFFESAYHYLTGDNVLSENNLVSDNLLFNNGYGAYITLNSSNNTFFNNSFYNSTYGFFSENAYGNKISNNVAFNNTRAGFNFTRSNNSYVLNNTAYGNPTGFGILRASNNTFDSNIVFNSSSGFSIFNSSGNFLLNNLAYNNSRGFLLRNSSSFLSNNTAFSSSLAGFNAINSNSTLIGSIVFNNTMDVLVNSTSGSFLLNMTNTSFLNPLGTLYNYTVLSILDSVTAGNAYYINWSVNNSALPVNRSSFENKFVDIKNISGLVSIDSITWSWLDSESGLYNENQFGLWKYNGSWSRLPATLDTSLDTLSAANLVPQSTYGILQSDAVSQSNLTYPNGGEFFMNYNESGANTGEIVNATWTQSDGGNYYLDYSNDSGTTWLPLAYTASTYLEVNISKSLGVNEGTNYTLRVTASDGVSNATPDTSDGQFWIGMCNITPNATGSSWFYQDIPNLTVVCKNRQIDASTGVTIMPLYEGVFPTYMGNQKIAIINTNISLDQFRLNSNVRAYFINSSVSTFYMYNTFADSVFVVDGFRTGQWFSTVVNSSGGFYANFSNFTTPYSIFHSERAFNTTTIFNNSLFTSASINTNSSTGIVENSSIITFASGQNSSVWAGNSSFSTFTIYSNLAGQTIEFNDFRANQNYDRVIANGSMGYLVNFSGSNATGVATYVLAGTILANNSDIAYSQHSGGTSYISNCTYTASPSSFWGNSVNYVSGTSSPNLELYGNSVTYGNNGSFILLFMSGYANLSATNVTVFSFERIGKNLTAGSNLVISGTLNITTKSVREWSSLGTSTNATRYFPIHVLNSTGGNHSGANVRVYNSTGGLVGNATADAYGWVDIPVNFTHETWGPGNFSIVVRGSVGYGSLSFVSDTPIVIQTGEVNQSNLSYPNGGEFFMNYNESGAGTGDVINVSWTNSSLGAGYYLDYSNDSGSTWYPLVYTSNISYLWNVSKSLGYDEGTNYSLRVTASDGITNATPDISDGQFWIGMCNMTPDGVSEWFYDHTPGTIVVCKNRNINESTGIVDMIIWYDQKLAFINTNISLSFVPAIDMFRNSSVYFINSSILSLRMVNVLENSIWVVDGFKTGQWFSTVANSSKGFYANFSNSITSQSRFSSEALSPVFNTTNIINNSDFSSVTIDTFSVGIVENSSVGVLISGKNSSVLARNSNFTYFEILSDMVGQTIEVKDFRKNQNYDRIMANGSMGYLVNLSGSNVTSGLLLIVNNGTLLVNNSDIVYSQHYGGTSYISNCSYAGLSPTSFLGNSVNYISDTAISSINLYGTSKTYVSNGSFPDLFYIYGYAELNATNLTISSFQRIGQDNTAGSNIVIRGMLNITNKWVVKWSSLGTSTNATRYFPIHVLNSTGGNHSGANVSVYNSTGAVVWNGTADSNGWVEAVVNFTNATWGPGNFSIVVRGSVGYGSLSFVSDTPIVIQTGEVNQSNLSYPNGGEFFMNYNESGAGTGDVINVSWTNSSLGASYYLDYSNDSGTNWYNIVYTGNISYLWNVSKSLGYNEGTNYTLRMTASDGVVNATPYVSGQFWIGMCNITPISGTDPTWFYNNYPNLTVVCKNRLITSGSTGVNGIAPGSKGDQKMAFINITTLLFGLNLHLSNVRAYFISSSPSNFNILNEITDSFFVIDSFRTGQRFSTVLTSANGFYANFSNFSTTTSAFYSSHPGTVNATAILNNSVFSSAAIDTISSIGIVDNSSIGTFTLGQNSSVWSRNSNFTYVEILSDMAGQAIEFNDFRANQNYDRIMANGSRGYLVNFSSSNMTGGIKTTVSTGTLLANNSDIYYSQHSGGTSYISNCTYALSFLNVFYGSSVNYVSGTSIPFITLHDSSVTYAGNGNIANLTMYNSAVLNATNLTVSLFAKIGQSSQSSNLTIMGTLNITTKSVGEWVSGISTNATRYFPVYVLNRTNGYVNGAQVNVTNGTAVLWSGYTDSNGYAEPNLSFTNETYNLHYNITASWNPTVTGNIDLTENTPIILQARCTDNDGDGFGTTLTGDCPRPEIDCDDTNASIFPPYDGIQIVNNTKFCPGTYYFIPNVKDASVDITANNLALDCNGAVLIGTNVSPDVGINIIARTNISVENCNISNFTDSFQIQNSANVSLKDSSSMTSIYGLFVNEVNNLSVYNFSAIESSTNGIYLPEVTNSTLSLVYIKDNFNGIVTDGGGNISFSNAEIYNSVQYGFIEQNLDSCSIADSHIYNNTVSDIWVENYGMPGLISVTNVSIDNPSGNFVNYTVLDFNDAVSLGDSYRIKWSNNPGSLPAFKYSFAGKFLNITNDSSSVSIDSISFKWLQPEITTENESRFGLWKYNGTWSSITATLDASFNTLTAANLVPQSIYAILEDTNNQPAVVLNEPADGSQINNTNSTTLNFTVTDDLNTSLSCDLYVDGVWNQTNSSVQNNTLTNFNLNVTLGSYSWYVNCTDGELFNVSETWYFTVNDTLKPDLTVESPVGGDNYTNATIDLNYTVSDNYIIGGCWYTKVSGGNVTLGGCANTTFEANQGNNNITVYVNDTSGNVKSVIVSFYVDSLPPGIENVTNGTITNQSAEIFWDTTEIANGSVEYGVTDSLGSTEDNSMIVLHHHVLISGLVNNTLYYYNVTGCDIFGNCNVSALGPFTFTTLQSAYVNEAPVVVLNESVDGSQINNTNNVTLNFTVFDDLSLSLSCDLYVNGNLNQTNGSVQNDTLTNFDLNVTLGSYSWFVNCSDGSLSNISDTWAFTVNDTLPPVIFNVNSTVTNETATINWTTDENANSTVSYGLTDALGSPVDDAVLVINHSVLITGLVNNTLYYFNVTSCDVYGNCNTSGPFTFTTLQNPSVNQAPVVVLNESADGSQINNTNSTTLNFTVTDDLNTSLSCGLYINGNLNQTNGSVQNNTLTNFDVNVTLGSYSWFVNCSDGSLSNISDTWAFTVNDTLLPSVSIISPALLVYNHTYILVNISAGDNYAVSRIWFEWNGTNTTYISPDYINFTDNSTITLTAYANDSSGNLNSAVVVFSTNASLSNVPLAIFSVSSTVTNESATIRWNTTVLANSTVEYGLSTALGSNATSASLVLSRQMAISGLANNTLYYFNVTSCDASTCVTSGGYSFTTLQNTYTPPSRPSPESHPVDVPPYIVRNETKVPPKAVEVVQPPKIVNVTKPKEEVPVQLPPAEEKPVSIKFNLWPWIFLMILILLFLLILILAKRKKEKKPDLVRMVILLRKSGLSNEDIKKKLVDAGWPEKMVEEAIKK